MVAIVFVLNDRVGDAVVVRSARLMIFDEEGIIERRAVERLRRRRFYYIHSIYSIYYDRGACNVSVMAQMQEARA